MKHAILILAHKDYSLLRHLIEYFTRECYIFVHVDKKAIITKEQIRMIEAMPMVYAVHQEIPVHWGGFSVLEAELFLLREAYKEVRADYYHVISGQDYPIKPLSAFLNYFENNRATEFIEYKAYSINNWKDPFFDRCRYYYFADEVNWQSQVGKRFMGELLNLQSRYNINRAPFKEFNIIYKGSQWLSLTRYSTEHIIEYTKNSPSFLQRLQLTFAPEEIYIQTVLLNAIHVNVRNDNLRFIRWFGENGNNPSNLGIEHFDIIQESNAFFARKMAYPYCKALIQAIDKQILKIANV